MYKQNEKFFMVMVFLLTMVLIGFIKADYEEKCQQAIDCAMDNQIELTEAQLEYEEWLEHGSLCEDSCDCGNIDSGEPCLYTLDE
jgi:hypothetical protein